MINPAKLLQFKKLWGEFESRHPKFVGFIHAVTTSGIGVGSIIEITVTTAEGKTYNSNMKLTEEDVELVKNFKDFV